MFGVALDRGGQRKSPVVFPTVGGRHCNDAELALCQRAGLIEDYRVDQPRFLKRPPIPHQYSVLGTHSG